MPRPHPSLLIHAAFDDSAIRRAHLRGALVRVASGRYVRNDLWKELGDADRYALTSMAAASRFHRHVVLSHTSAAALWGFPRIGVWPDKVHVIDVDLARTTTTATVTRHASQLDTARDVVDCEGVDVTTPLRTAIDLAVSAPLRQAVAALDHGLHEGMFTEADLVARLGELTGHGSVRARRAITLADRRACRALESLSRVVMYESQVQIPDLQRRFVSPSGQVAYVDCFWESVGLVGEADGLTKYLHSQQWSGLPAAEVVILEKSREDWLRADPAVKGFLRWTWADAATPGRLARLLFAAGAHRPRGRAEGAAGDRRWAPLSCVPR